MKAVMTHGVPMLGSTLDMGTITAPAKAARALPQAKVIALTLRVLIPKPARGPDSDDGSGDDPDVSIAQGTVRPTLRHHSDNDNERRYWE